MNMVRALARRRLMERLDARAERIGHIRLERPAVVLAPHPDDETLGCGGLIARKRALGVDVHVVFMTDGAGSHGGVSELVSTRRQEATEACHILGVPPTNLHFLEYPDGGLRRFEQAAADRVAKVLRDSKASQLVAPHPSEPPSDHHVTFRIAEHATSRSPSPVDTLLYPVWMWDQWPWTNPLGGPRRWTSRRSVVLNALRQGLGCRLVAQLSEYVDIAPVIERKRSALAAHRSQMDRPSDRTDWPTLHDISSGDWLELLMQTREFYGSTTLGGPGADDE